MKGRLTDVYNLLFHYYGPCKWWPADTPFEVCVGAILTQNTNWGNVEKAIANLRREGLLSPEALYGVSVESLADAVRPSGYYNVKSLRLKGFVEWLFKVHDGSLERMFSGSWDLLRKELLSVKGIGRETADSILLYAGHKPTFVIDAYTVRMFDRLGLLKGKKDYEAIRGMFMACLAADASLFNEYHALIVLHCKEFCRKKPFCERCILQDECAYGKK